MSDNLDLTITLKNITSAQAITFINFMKEMEYNGKIGHSASIAFFADGDGNFRPTIEHNFNMPDEKIQSYKDYCYGTITTARGNKISSYDFDGVAWKLDQEGQQK